MKFFFLLSLLSLLLQCKNASQVNSQVPTDITTEEEVNENKSWWRDTTTTAATAKAGEWELENFRSVWIDYDLFFEMLSYAPKEEMANTENRGWVELPLPNEETHVFAMHQVQVMSPELAEKYPQIKTYEGRSTTDPSTSIRLDFGENGASYQVIKSGEQIFLEPVTRGERDIYIIYYKKDVKKHPIDFEKPEK